MFTLEEKVNYEALNNIFIIKNKLADIASSKPILAFDFETIPKHTPKEKESLLASYEATDSKLLLSSIKSTGLSPPDLVNVSHLSIAWSKNDAMVVICSSDRIRRYVFDWLVEISNLQIWSNACFDFKHIYHHTGKFPKNYEDVQLIDKTRKNHCDNYKALVGLKETMGHMYGDWAVDKTSFTLDNMYKSSMLKYACIDACATFAKYDMLKYDHTIKPVTDTPIDLLPLEKHPIKQEPKEKDFAYRNVVKPLIEDFVQLMCTGIPIDLDKVQELETEVDNVLTEADEIFDKSELLQNYINLKSGEEICKAKEKLLEKKKTYKDYLVEFKPNNKVHRSFIINTFLKKSDKEKYLLEEWLVKDIKQLLEVFPSDILLKFYNKNYEDKEVKSVIEEGMLAFAEYKANIYNKALQDKISNLNTNIKFNPNSSIQIKEFMWDYLGIESDEVSDRTGNFSYNRTQLENILELINIQLGEK